jgi:exosortase
MTGEPPPAARTKWLTALLPFALLGAVLLWSSWPSLVETAARWAGDPRYSHGLLVPAFSLYLLWHRRAMVAEAAPRPSGWGLGLLLAGEAIRLAGARYYVSWFEALALIPSLAGLVLLCGGWRFLRWAWPSVAFLVFMIPLPYSVEMAMGYPLQRAAALTSNYVLQTVGFPAVADGNVILLNNVKVGVEEACNGLGMLFMFTAFTVATVLLVDRGPVEKGLILLSTAPIGLLANVTRISVTAALNETVGTAVGDVVYHDLAGWLMMPLAVAVLWLELTYLSLLFPEKAAGPAASAAPATGRVADLPGLVTIPARPR